MSNEGILSYMGYEKDLEHLKKYVMWNIFYVIIFSCEILAAVVAWEEISVMIMTYGFDYP